MKKLLLILPLIVAGTVFGQSVPSYFPTQGLIAAYLFTGNPADSSGNGNTGVVTGATLTTDRFGNANSAYYFNGT